MERLRIADRRVGRFQFSVCAPTKKGTPLPRCPPVRTAARSRLAVRNQNGRMGGSEAETIRQRRDRLKGHPQERQHRAPSSAKSGTECPRRGVPYRRQGWMPGRAETPVVCFRRLRSRQPDVEGRRPITRTTICFMIATDSPATIGLVKWMHDFPGTSQE
jgi:hypothetical protein